jgi:hypothetical protein
MGLEKLIKKFSNYLEGKKDGCDDVRELLEKFQDKQNKIEKKLDSEGSASKRKALKLELRIIKAQMKKGERLIRKKC